MNLGAQTWINAFIDIVRRTSDTRLNIDYYRTNIDISSARNLNLNRYKSHTNNSETNETGKIQRPLLYVKSRSLI